MIKTLLKFIVSGCILILPSVSQAQVGNNTEGDVSTPCSATGNMFGANTECTVTPTTYKITIHEMGLCTSHPFDADRLGATFDRTTCVTTYLDGSAAPAAIDVAALIGGAPQPLAGTSTPPAEGVYAHAYLIMGERFTVSGSFTDSTPFVHVTRTNNGVAADLVNIQETSDDLRNFALDTDANTVCRSGFLAATVIGGTIDAYVTDTTLTRSVLAGGATGGECDLSGRLVGVMNLSSPVTVTSDTLQVLFSFNLTNQGVQFIGNANTSTTNASSSGPFSGSFTVINN